MHTHIKHGGKQHQDRFVLAERSWTKMVKGSISHDGNTYGKIFSFRRRRDSSTCFGDVILACSPQTFVFFESANHFLYQYFLFSFWLASTLAPSPQPCRKFHNHIFLKAASTFSQPFRPHLWAVSDFENLPLRLPCRCTHTSEELLSFRNNVFPCTPRPYLMAKVS